MIRTKKKSLLSAKAYINKLEYYCADWSIYPSSVGTTTLDKRKNICSLIIQFCNTIDAVGWDKFVLMHPFIGGSFNCHKLNLAKIDGDITGYSGTLTHDRLGTKGNGIDGGMTIDAGLSGNKYTWGTIQEINKNNMSLMAYLQSHGTGAIGFVFGQNAYATVYNQNVGVNPGSGLFTMSGAWEDATYWNEGIIQQNIVSLNPSLGVLGYSRPAVNTYTAYINQSILNTSFGINGTLSTSSHEIPNSNIEWLASGGVYSDAQISFTHLGAGLTDAEYKFYSLEIHKLQAALGRAAY